MVNQNKLFVILISIGLFSCNLELTPGNTEGPTTTQNCVVTLETLDANSSIDSWRQFFIERGAYKIWKALAHNNNALDIDLVDLAIQPIDNQADEVIEGVLHYLTCFNPTIEQLTIAGDENNLSQKLDHLSPLIGQLIKLKFLDLTNNNLKELPQAIGDLASLDTLILANNQIKALPDSIGELTQLTMLDLTENQLVALPEAIAKLSNLISLDVYANQLYELSPAILNLPHIASLNICCNQLAILPANLDVYSDKKGGGEGNPWLQPEDLAAYKINQAALISLIRHQLPPSLMALCARWIDKQLTDKTIPAVDRKKLKEMLKNLPPGLQTKADLQAIIHKSHDLVQDKNIIYFNTYRNHCIPFYWDWGFYSQNDIKNLNNIIKDKQVYLISGMDINILRYNKINPKFPLSN